MPNYNSYAVPRLALREAILEYPLTQPGFIGVQLFPITPVMEKAGKVTVITRESITRARDVKRAVRSASNRDTYEGEDMAYQTEGYSHEELLDDEERAQYANDFDAELTTAQVTYDVLLREQEKRIAAVVQNTTTFTGAPLYTDRSGTPWATVGTDIIGHVDAAKDKVRTNCGVEADTLVISRATLPSLKNNTAILERVKYVARATEAEIVNGLADLFGLKRVLIGGAVKNTALEGAGYSGADVWSGTYAMICKSAVTKSLKEPGIGRTLLWTRLTPDNVMVDSYREEQTISTVFRVRQHTQEKLIDSAYGHLLKVA